MSRRFFRLSYLPLVAAALAAPLSAQGRVWIVDPAGGGNFTGLPAAVAAANAGDLIRVRAGTYAANQSVTFSKGLTILLDPAAVIPLDNTTGITVQGLPAGQQVVIKGGSASSWIFFPPSVTLLNNQGRVLLDRFLMPPYTGNGFSGVIVVTSCAQVQINACRFVGGSTISGNNVGPAALGVTASAVSVTDSVLQGAGSMGSLPIVAIGSSGLSATNSTVTISGGQIFGGLASRPPLSDLPGITATNSVLAIRGAAVVRGGNAPGVLANGGTLELDPSASVTQSVSGTVRVTTTWLPSLRGGGAPPNGIVIADLASPAGDILLFAASLSAQPTALGPTGDLWLDPALFFITGVAVQGSSGHTAHAVPLPGDPYLAFQAWTLQGLSGTFAGGFKLTNPVGIAID